MSLAIVAERNTHERANVLLKNGAFTAEESQALADAAAQAGHALVYAPHLPQSQLLDTDCARTFRELIHASAIPGKRTALVANYPRDISPATDDRPFFFMDKPTDLLALPGKTHGSRRLLGQLMLRRGVIRPAPSAAVKRRPTSSRQVRRS